MAARSICGVRENRRRAGGAGDLAGARSPPIATALPSEISWRNPIPGNAGWQHDLSVSHSSIGNVQVAQGRPSRGALTSYRGSLTIMDHQAKSDPG